ncbi:MAG: hypothetical protein RL518_1810 [Pseudomonadota bacterium]
MVASNRAIARSLHSILGEGFVAHVRREVLEISARYNADVRASALRRGIPLQEPETEATNESAPIIMAGHQPVVYHPGLLEKTKRLGMIASQLRAHALNVAIDTDEGEGGRLLWPLRQGDDIVIKQRSISVGGGLYRDQHVISKAQSGAVFTEMIEDLRISGCVFAIEGAERAAHLYSALEGESIVVANALARRVLCGAVYHEVPLSLLIEAPSLKEFIDRIVRDSERFVDIYNATLESYRREHKIKNPANPFPNMITAADEIELPLWEIVDGVRKAVVVSRAGRIKSANPIAPRGSIVTLLLRGVCCDLFIHGLGGAKYDQFVNAFAEAYWGVPLPSFVAASATECLFPDRVERFLHAREMKANYKQMVSHTGDFIGRGVFSQEDERSLAPLLERRGDLLQKLQQLHSKEERSLIAHELNEVNRRVKAAIDSSSVAPLLSEGAIDDARFSRWACREYPFFLFNT